VVTVRRVRLSRSARVLFGGAVALSAAVPVVLGASPAFAAGCTASVSNPTPDHNTTVTVTFVGPVNTSATVVAHYHGLDNTSTVTTDANGHGSAGFAIASADYGETVVVTIVVGTASCSTSFTPTAASTTGSTTTTTSAGATSTSTTASTTTTTAAALTAATTGGTTTGATTPAASLAFTGPAAGSAAVGGAALVLVGIAEVMRRRSLRRRS